MSSNYSQLCSKENLSSEASPELANFSVETPPAITGTGTEASEAQHTQGEEDLTSFDCPLCYERKRQTLFTLSCKHKACKECLHQWFEGSLREQKDIPLWERCTCPFCREIISLTEAGIMSSRLRLTILSIRAKEKREGQIALEWSRSHQGNHPQEEPNYLMRETTLHFRSSSSRVLGQRERIVYVNRFYHPNERDSSLFSNLSFRNSQLQADEQPREEVSPELRHQEAWENHLHLTDKICLYLLACFALFAFFLYIGIA